MDILLKRKTLTSQFIMPLLFNKKFSEIITDFEDFVNAYIADFDKPDYDNKIILVFNKKQKDLPKTNYIDKYTKTVKGLELYFYVYELPISFEDDYITWMLGRYSKLSEEAKKKILSFWEQDESNLMYGVLYRTGDIIKKFYKENLNEEIDATWLHTDKECWAEPVFTKEIYGAN